MGWVLKNLILQPNFPPAHKRLHEDEKVKEKVFAEGF